MSRHIGAIKLYIICIKKGRGYIPKKWNNIKKILRKTLPWKINTILSLRRVWCFKGFYKTTVWTLTNFLTMRTESYLDISESYLPIVMGWSIVWHSNQSVLPSKWSDKACSDFFTTIPYPRVPSSTQLRVGWHENGNELRIVEYCQFMGVTRNP